MSTNIYEMSDEEYEKWHQECFGKKIDFSEPNESNLIHIFTDAIRTIDPKEKANCLVNVANMCLALADQTLGCQVPVTTSFVLSKH